MAIPRSGALCRRQHADAFKVADLLDRAPSATCDIDRAKTRFATSHPVSLALAHQSLHKHLNETLEHVNIDDIIEHVTALGGVLTLQPQAGDGGPQISWGDVFFYYAPAGQLPKTQPFATIVTKNYPDEPPSGLDRADAFRLNISVGADEFRAITGRAPREQTLPDIDPSTTDVLLPHPVYGHLAWLAVVTPAERTSTKALELLDSAHRAAQARFQRRSGEAAPER